MIQYKCNKSQDNLGLSSSIWASWNLHNPLAAQLFFVVFVVIIFHTPLNPDNEVNLVNSAQHQTVELHLKFLYQPLIKISFG